MNQILDANQFYELNCYCDETIDEIKDVKDTNWILFVDNTISRMMIEKELLIELHKQKPNQNKYKIILEKYDILIKISYKISENMVRIGTISQDHHLEYCKKNLAHINSIKKVCDIAEKVTIIFIDE